MPTEPEKLNYLAGILDGDGYIIVSKIIKSGYHICKVGICNTDLGILNYCKSILNDLHVFYCEHKQNNKYNPLGKKTCYIVEVNRKNECCFLLEKVLPYLQSYKKEKAIQAITLLNSLTRRDGKKSNRRKHQGGD